MAVSAADAVLPVIVKLDGVEIWKGTPGRSPDKISYDFEDTDNAEHLLEIELSGKNAEHTKIAETGEILQDILITIDGISFDGINIDQLMFDLAEYHHDNNGNTSPVVDKFFGIMGCNGKVSLKFTTPVHLWLLENM